jgi:hypothetical protein
MTMRHGNTQNVVLLCDLISYLFQEGLGGWVSLIRKGQNLSPMIVVAHVTGKCDYRSGGV